MSATAYTTALDTHPAKADTTASTFNILIRPYWRHQAFYNVEIRGIPSTSKNTPHSAMSIFQPPTGQLDRRRRRRATPLRPLHTHSNPRTVHAVTNNPQQPAKNNKRQSTMDISIITASIGSFVLSERVIKAKAWILAMLGTVVTYDLTQTSEDPWSLRVYRGTSRCVVE